MDKKVSYYFNKLPSWQKEILEKVRTVIQNAAPLADEAMSYGVPAFKLHGRLLVAYAIFKKHIGLYPEPETIVKFEKELKNYITSTGTIQFSLSQPIPYDVIENIITYKYNKLL